MITPEIKAKIKRVVSCFETGRPEGRYDALVVYADGKNKTRQVTFGSHQTTEQSGGLKKLLEYYSQIGGAYKDDFAEFILKIGVTPLADDETFKSLLQEAGREDPLMRKAQDDFFDVGYWMPAAKWFDTNKFDLPLSMLVVYDSFIHSGGMRSELRQFPEKVPLNGGDEKAWIIAYIKARFTWLSNHTNPIVRKTAYRPQTFTDLVAADNWELLGTLKANGIAVPDLPPTV